MPAVFTWLNESDSSALEIDFDTTQKQAAGILKTQGKGGSRMSGLVGSGTLGENSYLNTKQRLSLLKSLSEVAKEYSVPLISGASAETKYELAKIIEGLSKVGVDTVMVMPPKTKAIPSEKEMYEYYELSEATANDVGVTIMPYNNPDAAGYHPLSTDLLIRLAVLPKVVALKISTVDVSIIETLMLENKDLKILAGVDTVTVHAGLAGACGGFLWWNASPARIFMGDTGSLALGGALGAIAVSIKHEIVLAIVGGVFVVEALSVIIQVLYFKRTGKRVFLMAPIHHHYEKKGWKEPQIVIRFWIISLILAMIGLATLKIR